MKLAAPPLTCDPVNPWRGKRKGAKEGKKRSVKRDYAREVEERRGENPPCHSEPAEEGKKKPVVKNLGRWCAAAGGTGEERTEATITQETFDFPHSAASSPPEYKRQQQREKKRKR